MMPSAACVDGDERSAHRNLGLAEPNIATDQPVRRLIGMHVTNNGLNGQLLVGCFLEGKAGFKARQCMRIHGELDAGSRRSASTR